MKCRPLAHGLRVQRRATKQLPGMKDLPYPETKNLKIANPCIYRRARGDMIETSLSYYMTNTMVNIPKVLVKLHASHISRGDEGAPL